MCYAGHFRAAHGGERDTACVVRERLCNVVAFSRGGCIVLRKRGGLGTGTVSDRGLFPRCETVSMTSGEDVTYHGEPRKRMDGTVASQPLASGACAGSGKDVL